MAGISDPFAGFGPAAKTKLVILGSAEALMNRLRSLNLEHVSPVQLKGLGISRVARATSLGLRPGSPAAEEQATLALMRRWFFARKPDAGFVVTGFPATLLQARVFDEWLEARDETLSGVIVTDEPSSQPVVQHYRTLGLVLEAGDLAA